VREDRVHESLDLKEIAAEVVEITRGKWKNEAERRGVKVEVSIDAREALTMMGSRAEIREALTNLIFNAVDALPQGGHIAVRCRADGDAAVIEVSDNGTGMPEDVRSRMFEPFFTTKGLSGTGLGLSMVYGIVTRHHGTIEVETSAETGTTVRMLFPAAEHAEPEAAPEARPQRRFSARILVVDDEAELLSLLQEALTTEGHEVTTASTGAEGVALFRGGEFEVVLTDLGMPDVSGWDLARVVRDEGRSGIVLGLVTGWGATISEEMVASHGVDFVVGKPFDVQELIAKVNHAAESKRAPKAGPTPSPKAAPKKSRATPPKRVSRGSAASPSGRRRT
jgi:CheY-like chemotaxis protein/anti-sigma regulatory factor (Ser/Thr protein kinase)